MGGPEEGLKALGLAWGEPSAIPQSQCLLSLIKPQPIWVGTPEPLDLAVLRSGVLVPEQVQGKASSQHKGQKSVTLFSMTVMTCAFVSMCTKNDQSSGRSWKQM